MLVHNRQVRRAVTIPAMIFAGAFLAFAAVNMQEQPPSDSVPKTDAKPPTSVQTTPSPTATNPRPGPTRLANAGLSVKAQVIDDAPDFAFVKEGESMPIRALPDTTPVFYVDFTMGRSTVDNVDPSKVVVYPFPFFWLIPNPHPDPGMPDILWKVSPKKGKIYATVKVGWWSDKFKDACKQHWLAANRVFLDHEPRPAISRVSRLSKRPPVIDLFIAAIDSQTKLVLAFDQQTIRRSGDVIEFVFPFEDRDAFRAFLEAYREGELSLQPICASNKKYVLGMQRVDAGLDIGLQVSNELTSEQREKGAKIDQITADRIARDVSGEIKETVVIDGVEILPMLTSTNMLVQMGILQPADWMTWEDFKRAHGENAERMIEEHLGAEEEVQTKGRVEGDNRSKTSGRITVKRDGGGWGFSLPFVGLSRSDEEVKRDLNILTESSGVELQSARPSTCSCRIASGPTVFPKGLRHVASLRPR